MFLQYSLSVHVKEVISNSTVVIFMQESSYKKLSFDERAQHFLMHINARNGS